MNIRELEYYKMVCQQKSITKSSPCPVYDAPGTEQDY